MKCLALISPLPASRLKRASIVEAVIPHPKHLRGACVLPLDRVLSWGSDGKLRLWSAEGREITAPWAGHGDAVSGARLLSNGHVLSWAHDASIRMWDQQGNPVCAPWSGHRQSFKGVIELTEGRILSWERDRLLLWNSSGTPLCAPKLAHGYVAGALGLTDGRVLSWDYNGVLRVWDGYTLNGGARWSLPRAGVTGARQLSSGQILTWGGSGFIHARHFCLWSGERPGPSWTGIDRTVDGAIELSDGGILSWGSGRDGREELSLWTNAGQQVGDPWLGHESTIFGACELSTGEILSWSWDGTLRLWRRSGEPVGIPWTGHKGTIQGCSELSGGKVWSWDEQEFRLWKGSQEPIVGATSGHHAKVIGATPLVDGRVVSWAGDGSVVLWSALGEPSEPCWSHPGISGTYQLSDESVLCWGGGQLRFWRTSEASPDAPLVEDTPTIGIRELQNGQMLLWDSKGKLQLRARTGELVGAPWQASAETHPHWMRIGADGVHRAAEGFLGGVCELSSGQFLTWDDMGHEFTLWTAQGKKVGHPWSAHTHNILGARQLSNGQVLSWGAGGPLLLWSDDGTPIGTPLTGHDQWINGICELSSRHVVSRSRSGKLCIWTPSGEAIGTSWDAHAGSVLGVRELQGGLLSWGEDQTIALSSLRGEILVRIPVDASILAVGDRNVIGVRHSSLVFYSLAFEKHLFRDV